MDNTQAEYYDRGHAHGYLGHGKIALEQQVLRGEISRDCSIDYALGYARGNADRLAND